MSALLAALTLLSLAAKPTGSIDGQTLAAQLASATPPRVVDLRGPAAHAVSHIPGAAPSSAWALARSGALRRQHLVVVDSGLPGGPADQLSAQLGAQGVHIVALRGGFRAWCEAGLPTSAPCGRVDVVSAAEVAGRAVLSQDDVPATGAVVAPVVAAASGALPPPRPGVFWLEGGQAAAQAVRAPAALGSHARVGLAKPSGSPISSDAASCGCKR